MIFLSFELFSILRIWYSTSVSSSRSSDPQCLRQKTEVIKIKGRQEDQRIFSKIQARYDEGLHLGKATGRSTPSLGGCQDLPKELDRRYSATIKSERLGESEKQEVGQEGF